jgi:hypothetical protein
VLDVDEKTVRNDLRTNSAASADNLRSLRQISKTLASRGHLTGGGSPALRLRCTRCCEAVKEAAESCRLGRESAQLMGPANQRSKEKTPR